MLIHKTNIRIRYADTDQMQYAYNGKHFEYFEVGRTEMMREQNLTYKTIEANGYMMPVYWYLFVIRTRHITMNLLK